jgi:hypothetical protein
MQYGHLGTAHISLYSYGTDGLLQRHALVSRTYPAVCFQRFTFEGKNMIILEAQFYVMLWDDQQLHPENPRLYNAFLAYGYRFERSFRSNYALQGTSG